MTVTGRVVWITGLSGAGKTTVAKLVHASLKERGVATLHLDGDAMREALADPNYGFDRESRLRGARFYGRLARMCAEQGLVVVVSTISLFHEIHDWNREQLPGYLEVLIEASDSVRRSRDPKGLYKGLDQGSTTSMGGVDLALELPISPHLRIANDGGPQDIPRVAGLILDSIDRTNGTAALSLQGTI